MSVSDNAVLETASTEPHPYIHERLDRIKHGIEDADHQTRMLALLAGDIYAILSVQTPVGAHERAFLDVWYDSPSSEDELADILHKVRGPQGSDNVLFHNAKARYIWKALHEVDYNEQAELYRDGDWRSLQQHKIDHVMGLGSPKSAFSTAVVGGLDVCCVDQHIADAFDYDRTYFGGIIADTYGERVAELREQTPKASSALKRFPWQWAVWDAQRPRGGEVHDPWFWTIEDLLDTSHDSSPVDSSLSSPELSA